MALDFSRRLATIFALALVLGPTVASAQRPKMPPPRVSVLSVETRAVPLVEILPGRTVAFAKVDVRPQVAGLIQKRLFEEGAHVQAGQALYRINADTYRAVLNAAQADVAKSQARYALSRKKLTRYKSLLRTQAASQQVYDDAVATVAEDQAALTAAQARVETAMINLRRTTITAPITGLIGRSEISVGSLVTADQAAPLATITALDPIYVDLSESSNTLLDLRQKIARGAVEKPVNVPVTLLLDSHGTVYPHQGALQFTDALVRSSTATVGFRAVFPNPDHVLLPGMFVRAKVTQGQLPDGALIPQRAVMRMTDGAPYVWIVGVGDTIVRRKVTIERAIGGDWLVSAGLNNGDKVVVDGTMKVAAGTKVIVYERGAKVSGSPAPASSPSGPASTPH